MENPEKTETRNLEWRCLTCGETAPPTGRDYMQLIKHAKGHEVRLVDVETGEELASTPKQAIGKGLITKEGAVSKVPGEKVDVTTLEVTEEGLIRYTITLPADAFALFNIAKAFGMEPEGKSFDEWDWECITARFEKDYKKQLILAPIGEE